MSDDRVNAKLTDANKTALTGAVDTMSGVMPWLIDLTPEQRQTMLKMGDKSRAFVEKAAIVATNNPDIMPRSFDLDGYQNDVTLFADLGKFRGVMAQLLEKIDDTLMQVGSEAYAGSLLVYQMANAVGKGAGLDEALDDMGKRFARKSKTVAENKTT
jgi:hypothetical protein